MSKIKIFSMGGLDENGKNLYVVKVDEDKAMKWLSTGAIPTDTVRNIFSKEGIMKKFHESKMKKEA